VADTVGQRAAQAGARSPMGNAGVKEEEDGWVAMRLSSWRSKVWIHSLPCTHAASHGSNTASRSSHSLGQCLLPPKTQLKELCHSLPLCVASRAPDGCQPAENRARHHVVACRTPRPSAKLSQTSRTTSIKSTISNTLKKRN